MTTQDSKGRRTIPGIKRLADKRVNTAELKDHSMQSVVTLQWHLNPASKRDQIFQIDINGQTALISLEELTSYTRMM